jgi:hypothetical protein
MLLKSSIFLLALALFFVGLKISMASNPDWKLSVDQWCKKYPTQCNPTGAEIR